MRRYIIPALLLAVILFAALFAAPVDAISPDAAAIRGILSDARSPLPPWTLEAFADSHRDFDIAGYLAVMQCESGLGTTGKSKTYCNPGNIIFVGWAPGNPYVAERPWLLWQCGYFESAGQLFGAYPSMYIGQRAAIRLFYESGYNEQLRTHKWFAFAIRYYGDKPGLDIYIRNLVAAHARFVRAAAVYGAVW